MARPDDPAKTERHEPEPRSISPSNWLWLVVMLAWPATMLGLEHLTPGPVTPAPYQASAATQQGTAPASESADAAAQSATPAAEQRKGVFWQTPTPGKVKLKLFIPAPNKNQPPAKSVGPHTVPPADNFDDDDN